YNTAGLISSETDSGGHSTAYAYDSTNTHLLSATTDDGKTTAYTYQSTGSAAGLNALLSITDGGVTQTFTYDDEGRLASTYLANNQQRETFTYDIGGLVNVSDAFGTTAL